MTKSLIETYKDGNTTHSMIAFCHLYMSSTPWTMTTIMLCISTNLLLLQDFQKIPLSPQSQWHSKVLPPSKQATHVLCSMLDDNADGSLSKLEGIVKSCYEPPAHMASIFIISPVSLKPSRGK
jgi:hypothetical protein